MWRAAAAAVRRLPRRNGPLSPHVAPPASRRGAAIDGFTLPTPQTLSEIVKLEVRVPAGSPGCGSNTRGAA